MSQRRVFKPQRQTHELVKDQAPTAWEPTFKTAFQLILILRFSAAMYSVIADCDETFNYWEPLHFLQYGRGFQAWEYSPQYAIRSWSYLVSFLAPGQIAQALFRFDKRPAFLALRSALALISSLVEAGLYRSIVTNVNARVGRYTLVFLLFSAGMWNASTTLLPSTFALHMVNVAYIWAMSTRLNDRRTLVATASIALAALLGWPFAAALGIPFVLEEIYWGRLWAVVKAAALSSLFAVPIALIDSCYYGKSVFYALNIVKYNVVSNSSHLYGVEPPTYYLVNGLLNFNLVMPLALAALPVIWLSRLSSVKATFLSFRVLPVYVWLAILTIQPHKEERFLFPAYGLICFNAAVTLYLVRSWVAGPSSKSSTALSSITFVVLAVISFVSIARIAAVTFYYKAPMDVAGYFAARELPRLAVQRAPELFPTLSPHLNGEFVHALHTYKQQFDLSSLDSLGLTICWGKEWYRFPGSYLIPSVAEPRFVKSAFAGIIPKPFTPRPSGRSFLDASSTRLVPSGFNDQNLEVLENYTPIEQCDYLVDLDYPHRFSRNSTTSDHILEPRYVQDARKWERVFCLPFLDNNHSPWYSRALYLPLPGWTAQNKYGDYCLLRSRTSRKL